MRACVCVCMCVCVFACVRERRGKRERDKARERERERSVSGKGGHVLAAPITLGDLAVQLAEAEPDAYNDTFRVFLSTGTSPRRRAGCSSWWRRETLPLPDTATS